MNISKIMFNNVNKRKISILLHASNNRHESLNVAPIAYTFIKSHNIKSYKQLTSEPIRTFIKSHKQLTSERT